MNAVANDVEGIAALIERGDLAGAEARAREAREAYPDDSETARLHGVALLMLRRPEEAREAFERAIELAPGAFPAYCNLSSALLALDRASEAMHTIERALATMPANPILWNALANACRATGDHLRARNVYRAALSDAPGDVGLLLNLAATEMTLGEMGEAEHLVRLVLSRMQVPEGWLLLGHIHKARREFAKARDAYAQGARLAPRDPIFPHHCGLADEDLNRFESALVEYTRTLELDQNFVPAISQLALVKRRVLDWQRLDILAKRLREEVARGNPDVAPFSFLAEDTSAAEQLACSSAQARHTATRARESRLPSPPAKPAGAPLRVGFVSAGFHAHPTGLLVVAMFEELARLDLEMHLFATSPEDNSPVRQRLRAAAKAFQDVSSHTSLEIARRVRAAGIDVLVDLDVWCGGGVPSAFAMRPAPVQVNWLGYPGSSGAEFYDYVIADRFVLPDSLRPHFSEKVAWLPRCYQPTDPTRELGEPPPRPAFHLPEDGVVFASFNNSWKLNPASLSRMCAVLREVPGSVLWLLDAGREANARLRTAAHTYGVDPQRFVFSPKLPHTQHLARHRHADLFLDTHPYNAHTTASDALWAGCPVLTAPGETFASRVAGSLNHFLRMGSMNARDDAAFIRQAIQLAHDPGALAALRIRLQRRKRETDLFDMRRYARDFAALLHAMAQRRRAGLGPEDLDGADLRPTQVQE
ncbi:MAG TPA: tetratricopeptide repeat protein [Rhodanobacteraceae bacterium]|nr:tetratricopeptide repeat protein [Rhodanobacteraceae bacterium]